MINERIERLKTRAKATLAALKEKLAAAACWITPTTSSAGLSASMFMVASEGNVLDMGKRYRNTSGHAPLFSLYTFFGKGHN
jgi:hypothetical protein